MKKINLLVINSIKICGTCSYKISLDKTHVVCEQANCCKNKINLLTKDCPKGKWKSPKTLLDELLKVLKKKRNI